MNRREALKKMFTGAIATTAAAATFNPMKDLFAGSVDDTVDVTKFPNTAEGRKRAYNIAKARTLPQVSIQYLDNDPETGSKRPKITAEKPKYWVDMEIKKDLGLQVFVDGKGHSYDIFFGTEAEYKASKLQTTGRKAGPKRLKKFFFTKYTDKSVFGKGKIKLYDFKSVDNRGHDYDLKDHKEYQIPDKFVVTNNTDNSKRSHDTLDWAINGPGIPVKLRFSEDFNPDEPYYIFVTIYDQKGGRDLSRGYDQSKGDKWISDEVIKLNFK